MRNNKLLIIAILALFTSVIYNMLSIPINTKISDFKGATAAYNIVLDWQKSLENGTIEQCDVFFDIFVPNLCEENLPKKINYNINKCEYLIRKNYSIPFDYNKSLLGMLMYIQRDKFLLNPQIGNFYTIKKYTGFEGQVNLMHGSIIPLNKENGLQNKFALIIYQNGCYIDLDKSYIDNKNFYQTLGVNKDGEILDKTLEEKVLKKVKK